MRWRELGSGKGREGGGVKIKKVYKQMDVKQGIDVLINLHTPCVNKY
jgi:hypothetical protein